MFLLACLPAAAAVFGAVGGEVALLDRSGNWPRAFPAEEGWHLLAAAGGEYHHALLSDDLVASTWSDLTGRADLVDHGVAACPDGSFLHVASATRVVADDTAYAFRYDATFSLVAEGVLADAEVDVIHRDQPVACGATAQGTGFFAREAHVPFRWVPVDAAGAAGTPVDLYDAPLSTGASLAEHDGTLWLVGFPPEDSDDLVIRGLDPVSLAIDASHQVAVTDDTRHAYWSQAVVRVGDGWVVAYMARDESAGWQDQDGDVWLAAFDADWTLLEQVQVTHDTPPIGSMQPSVAYAHDRLLVTWTRDLEVYGAYVELAAAPGPGDTAEDTAVPEDSAAEEPDLGVPPTERACGCDGSEALLFAPMGVLGIRRRRRA